MLNGKREMFAPRLLIQLACSLLVATTVVSGLLGLVLSSDGHLYVAFACIAGALPLATTLLDRRGADLFSPISFIALAVLFGTTATSFWLTNTETIRQTHMMFGLDFATIAGGQYWVILGLISLCLGYVLVVPKFRDTGQIRSMSSAKVRIIMISLLAVSTLGTVLFAASFGIDFSDFTGESIKRNTQYIGESGDVVYGTGFEVFLARLSGVGFIFSAGLIVSGRKSAEYYVYSLLFLSLTILVGFISSSRTSIVYTVASLVIFSYYYKKISWKAIFAFALFSVAIVSTLGVIRADNSSNNSQYQTIADLILGTGNGFDAVRTVAFIERVPERHNFLYGSSYVSLITSPIPRSLWPDKPNVSLGPWVKSELYGLPTQNNGWPPGMVAEAYFNFGYVGIPLVMFLFGALLRLIYASLRPYLGVSALLTMAYSVGMFRLAYNSLSLNLSQGILQTAQYIWPLLLIGLYTSTKRRSSVMNRNNEISSRETMI
jgi:oligosaccharide repeat unit polymerase